MTINHLEEQDKSFVELYIQKILDYTRRQSNRTVADKETDFEELSEEQEKWFDERMEGPNSAWDKWFVGLYFTEEKKRELGLSDKDIAGKEMK